MKIIRKGVDINMINISYVVTSEVFIRALHKCTANLLCLELGSKETRRLFPDLIEFVFKGGGVEKWSYAASFPFPYQTSRPFGEPRPVEFKTIEGKVNVIVFLHSSGIWVTATNPYALDYTVLQTVSKVIEKILIQANGEKIFASLGFKGFDLEGRNSVGSLNFCLFP